MSAEGGSALLVREALEEERWGSGLDAKADAEAGPAADPEADLEGADADTLEDLGDEIATLAAHIHAATQRLLALIAEFDRRRGWALDGHRSCAHWLAFRTGIDLGAAREKVRTARALVELPRTSEAMARGELSFSQVRALTRVATRENEAELVALASGSTTAQVERMVRGWKRGHGKDEAALERERHAMRTLSVFPDLDGTYVVRGRLTPEIGVLVQRAIEAASDALYREDREHLGEREEERRRAAARRRADALGLLAARAMSAGLGGRCGLREQPEEDVAADGREKVVGRAQPAVTEADGEAGTPARTGSGAETGADIETGAVAAMSTDEAEAPGRSVAASSDDTPPSEPSAASGTRVLRLDSWRQTVEVGRPAHLHTLPCTCDVPISGTRADRYQVVLHVDEKTLRSDEELGDAAQVGWGSRSDGRAASSRGRSDLEDGTRVSSRYARRSRGWTSGCAPRVSELPLGSPETSRRVSCDSGLVRITHAADGSILDVGRRTRTISPALRRALEARDRGCRFPGCGLRFTDAHHVRHWADGGETSLSNCLLLCHFHHTLVHEGGWEVGWWGPGRAVFFDPRGGTHFDGRWEPPELPAHPVRALVEQNREAGARPDAWTAGARWKREADIPDDVYFKAVEGLG